MMSGPNSFRTMLPMAAEMKERPKRTSVASAPMRSWPGVLRSQTFASALEVSAPAKRE